MKTTFSAYWSDELCAAIKAKSVKPYPIECHAGSEEFKSIEHAILEGIDAHLEALFFTQGVGQYGRYRFVFEPQCMHTLIRRLMESGCEESELLASDICGTLGIELI